MTELLRVASLTGYFETMVSLDCDPRPLLREQGFRPICWSIRNS
jgi:hypothetical protein